MTHAKPLWFEGMLLKPQHFQQLQAHIEKKVAMNLPAYHWGIENLVIDESHLNHGHLVVSLISGISANGIWFDSQDNAVIENTFILDPKLNEQAIYLIIDNNTPKEEKLMKADEHNAKDKIEVDVGKLKLYLSNESNTAHESIQIAKVLQNNDRFSLSQFCCPKIYHKPNTLLLKLFSIRIKEIINRQQVAESPEEKMNRLFIDIESQKILSLIRRIDHGEKIHPQILFLALDGLYNLSSQIAKVTHIQPTPYEHENLDQCYNNIMDDIEKTIALIFTKTNKHYFKTVNSNTQALQLNESFDRNKPSYISCTDPHFLLHHHTSIKLCPAKSFEDIVKQALPGIEITSIQDHNEYQLMIEAYQIEDQKLILYSAEPLPADKVFYLCQD